MEQKSLTLRFVFEELNKQTASRFAEGVGLMKGVKDKNLAFDYVVNLNKVYNEPSEAITELFGLNMKTLNTIYKASRGDESLTLKNGDRFAVHTVPELDIVHLCIVQNDEIYIYRTNKRTLEITPL